MNNNQVNQFIKGLLISEFGVVNSRNSEASNAFFDAATAKIRHSIEEVMLTFRLLALDLYTSGSFDGSSSAVGDAPQLIRAATTDEIQLNSCSSPKEAYPSQQPCQRSKIEQNHQSALEREFAASLRVVKSAMARA